jgi:outer membrane protein OmpA-like peptidoglycan-associated protein
MNVRLFSTLSVILITLVTSDSYSGSAKSDLDKAKEYVNSYLHDQDNNTLIQSDDTKTQLTKLLKGMHGIELNIYFKTNSDEIDKRGRSQIYDIAKTMLVYPDPMVRFRLDAHTDIRGSEAHNIELSKKRLESVQNVFKNAMGSQYDSKRFYTGINGEKFATYKKVDEEGMYFDRRVTITLFVQSG